MKRQVEYHEVAITFLVSERETARVTSSPANGHRAKLSQLIYDAITGNGTNCLDAENVTIVIDGKRMTL